LIVSSTWGYGHVQISNPIMFKPEDMTEVIELGPAYVQNNGSAPIPETKVSTDLILNLLMKQNEILINLLS